MTIASIERFFIGSASLRASINLNTGLAMPQTGRPAITQDWEDTANYQDGYMSGEISPSRMAYFVNPAMLRILSLLMICWRCDSIVLTERDI